MYPFYYVAFVEDKNLNAYQRMGGDLNIGPLPTVYFDGGYRLSIGAANVPSAEAEYMAKIDTCGMRPVPDTDISLLVGWSGNARMYIEVAVQNNEAIIYEGRIRVYVTEITSSMGWNDTQGNPYTFTFLDYAFNEDIYIEAEDSWQKSTIWDGNDHTDGYGHDFGNITFDNTKVIAAVFNGERHQGYANPPWGHPFDAYYVDEVAPGLWVNFPPFTPADPTPQDQAPDVDIDVDLNWTGGDPNEGDTVTYDVYLGTSTSPPLVSSNQSATTYDPGIILYKTTYYWKIVARDNHDTSTAGPIWSFNTIPEWIRGDCNRDREINISDAVYMVNYVFKNGPEPDPLESGNVDCDADVNITDVVYLINYLFKLGPAPCQ